MTSRDRRFLALLAAGLVGVVLATSTGLLAPSGEPGAAEAPPPPPADPDAVATSTIELVASDSSRPFAQLAAEYEAELAAAIPPDAPGAAGPEAALSPEAIAEREKKAEARRIRKASLPRIRIVAPIGAASDPTLENPISPAVAAPALASIDGIGEGFAGVNGTHSVTLFPPDANGDVSDRQIVQVANVRYAVFDKQSGEVQLGPVDLKALWSGFQGPCGTNNDGDPTVRWDEKAGRWVVGQFSISGSSTSKPYYQCLAVSKTADALGEWHRYAFSHTQLPDFPKLSIWHDGYYVTFYMFTRFFQGSKVCAYPRDAMISGNVTNVTFTCFQTSTQYGGLLAGDLDRSASPGGAEPTAGTPNVIVALGPTNDRLVAWRFRAGDAAPTGPVSIPVAPFLPACDGGVCIPQAGTTTKLDSLGDRLGYRFPVRWRGSDGTAVAVHSVALTSTSGARTGIRWYQLRIDATGGATVVQQGTYAPDDGLWRWMPSIAQDVDGNVAVGYNASGTSASPTIRVAGRTAGSGAAAGALDVAEATVDASAGSLNSSYTRWGDYASMTLDPNGCTFWHVGEHVARTHAYKWNSRITSFALKDGCTPGTYSRTASTIETSGGSTTVARATATTVRATLTSGGSPVAGRQLVFRIFDRYLAAVTDATGTASVTVTTPRKAATTTVTVRFGGDRELLSASATGRTIVVQ
ncbi:MAG: hypothetical protein RL338_1363 [Chloroflexota bacterium]